jgi:hypothetical protein
VQICSDIYDSELLDLEDEGCASSCIDYATLRVPTPSRNIFDRFNTSDRLLITLDIAGKINDFYLTCRNKRVVLEESDLL